MKAVLYLAFLLALSITALGARHDGYAVVAKRQTFADAGWNPVVGTLLKKHNAQLILYDSRVEDVLPELRTVFPKYTCFVVQPEEAGREFVARLHVMSRKLDEDPYPDTVWSILTGYVPGDALRIAKREEPLVVKRCLTGTVGSPLDPYDEGIMFDELKANRMWEKTAGGIAERKCPTDTIRLIVDSLNDYEPDVFITSGHATERNWMPGYGYRNGAFKCKEGKLFGQDTKDTVHYVNSPNPKVHLPVGNCLIAHVKDRECMALALMHSAGVYQMVGYTIPTGYGYGGWGVKDYFSELQAGRFSLAESHFANQIAMICNLEKLNQNAEQPTRRGGLRGDRDTVVMYGDPAWEARMQPRKLLWSQDLKEENGEYTFTVTCNATGDWDNRPIVHFFDERLADVRITEGEEHEVVITDDFILLKLNSGIFPMKGNRGEVIPIKGEFERGQKFMIKFKAIKMSERKEETTAPNI